MANAVAASALDWDDGHYRGGGIHPGSTVIPALLAVSGVDTDVEEFLRAQIVGYEVAVRTGYLISPGFSGGAYRTSGAASALGAAVAVAALLGADGPGIERAMRIAAAHAPYAGLQLSAVKESIGWAAATGVTAAWLALDGFADEPAPTMALGMAATSFDGPVDAFVSSWGTVWESANCYIKPYPCCRAAHAALDGVLALRAEHPGDPIRAIDVETIPGAAALDDRHPRTLEERQFSIPYAIAEALHEPDLIERVRIRPAPDLADTGNGYPARVTLTTTTGSWTAEVPHARGSVERPLTPDELAAKVGPALLVPAADLLAYVR